MRKPHLGGWLRITVVLSVLWIVGGTFSQNQGRMKFAGDMAAIELEICSDKHLRHPEASIDCTKAFDEEYRKAWDISPSFWQMVIGSLITLPLVWLPILIIRGTIFTYRWIKEGFARPGRDAPDHADTKEG